MSLSIAGRLRQGLPFVVEQRELNRRLGPAVFQALREYVKLVVITVQRHANVAESKERGGITVAVLPRWVHHRDIDAGLLQRRNIFQRQQQFFPRVACRVKVETSGVNQIRHFQQFVRFPVAKRTAVLPLADKRRQRLRLHAEEVNVYMRHVKHHYRQPVHHFARQQRATAGEANAWGNIAGGQRFLHAGAEGGLIQRSKLWVNGDNQVALRLQMTQTQLFQIRRQLPGSVHLAAFLIHHVDGLAEILLGIERNRERQHQRCRAVELNL